LRKHSGSTIWPSSHPRRSQSRRGAGMDVWGVRYQVTDVARAVEFYTTRLGFRLEHQQGSVFAKVACGSTSLFLSGPGVPGRDRCPTGVGKSQAGGTAWS
jgi:glyoxylase I family protein